MKEAHRLWRTVARPNLMVKIPATAAGVPAIEHCIADGLNINVTLIFSLERYDEVMDAYIGGLEKRAAAKKPIDRIASVASFFVSRVDSAVDKLLDEQDRRERPDQQAQLQPARRQGRDRQRQARLRGLPRRSSAPSASRRSRSKGARLQRPLWASTSTKNPAYPDVYYVEALVGPDTVDTMPPATIVAYKDHGKPALRLDEGLDAAAAVLQRIEDAGISMDAVTQEARGRRRRLVRQVVRVADRGGRETPPRGARRRCGNAEGGGAEARAGCDQAKSFAADHTGAAARRQEGDRAQAS